MDRAKCSHHRHRWTELRSLFLVSLVCLSASVRGQVAAGEPPLSGEDAWPEVMDRFFAEVQTYQASFSQQVHAADGTLIEQGSGAVAFQRPDRFRWDYRSPYEQVILADGEFLWMHDVEIEQVSRMTIDEQDMASPAMLLGGDAIVRSSFSVVGSAAESGLDWVTLEPVGPSPQFSSVRLGFDQSVLAAIEFVDALAQTTLIRFADAQVNPRLGRNLFTFSVPRGASVIGMDD